MYRTVTGLLLWHSLPGGFSVAGWCGTRRLLLGLSLVRWPALAGSLSSCPSGMHSDLLLKLVASIMYFGPLLLQEDIDLFCLLCCLRCVTRDEPGRPLFVLGLPQRLAP